jgi:hypothetical protein
MNIVNKEFLRTNFPPIKFAFISNYIVRTSRIRKLKEKEKPVVDTIIVCEDIDQWHKENFKRNKKHYPLISKYTSYKLVTYFQKKGAKIHFNNFTNPEGNLLRYGVVSWEDFLKDLDLWKTLTVSTYMQKPFDVIIDNQEVDPHQKKNLISAICIGALFHLGEGADQFVVPEKEFYDTIIKIPFIQGSYFKIFDDKDINFELDDIIHEFREIYTPILQELAQIPDWENFISFDNQNYNFVIKNDFKAKKFFLDNLNLQIYREISGVSHGKINLLKEYLFDLI